VDDMHLDRALKIFKIKLPVLIGGSTEDAKDFLRFMKEARKKWKKLMVLNHPDRGGDHEAAILINQAWERIKEITPSDCRSNRAAVMGLGGLNYDHNVFREMLKQHQKRVAKTQQEMLDAIHRNIYQNMFGLKPGTRKGVHRKEDQWFEEFLKQQKEDS
jgi:hypothetical protein